MCPLRCGSYWVAVTSPCASAPKAERVLYRFASSVLELLKLFDKHFKNVYVNEPENELEMGSPNLPFLKMIKTRAH